MNGEALAPPVKKFTINKYHIIIFLIFVAGCLVRLIGIGTMFTGINQDEASIAYDAYAILGWGIDRNGVSLPAYLISWGSGQNAGYAYLLMPFIQLFGLSLTTLRLPMALVGCVSLWALYTILKRHEDKKLALVGLFLFAICPWHILKSRWALESNLLPDLLLWATALLCAGIAYKKKRYFYLGFFVFGLSAWAYATSFLVLPFFILPVAFVLWKRRYLTIPHLAGCFGVFLLASWPIILFAFVMLFDLPTIHTPIFTIPAMLYSRGDEFAVLSGNPFMSLLQNAKRLFQMVTSQDDLLLLNSIPGFGVLYLVSLPLVVVGFFRTVLPRKHGGKYRGIVPGSWIFLPWCFAACILGMLIWGNINRYNALWIPLIWFWILGAYELVCLDGLWRRVVPIFYAVLFLLFCNTMFGEHMRQINISNDAGFTEAVQFADSLGADVYTKSTHETYIRILYATGMPPEDYLNSGIVKDEGEGGEVLRFGKWHCYELPEPPPEGPYAVIVKEQAAEGYRALGWREQLFENYVVLWPPTSA